MFRRILAALLLIVLAVAMLVAVWPQLFGLQRAAVLAQLVSFRGSMAVIALLGALVLLVLALLSRTFRRLGSSMALLLLVFALVSTAVLATRGFGNGSFSTRGKPDITVMAWNTLGDAPGAEAIAKLALDSHADIIALPETTRATALAVAAIMKAGGRPMWEQTIAFDQISKARSTSVLTSVGLGSYHVDTTAGSTTSLPTIVMSPDHGTGPVIVATHPVAPIPTEMSNWRADLAWLSKVCRARNVIVAGDFNSTLDHLAGLGADPSHTLGTCADAALKSGNAAVGTWPTAIPAILGAPIDHVMVTDNWRVTGMRVVQNLDTAGSDHRPILVQLHPTG